MKFSLIAALVVVLALAQGSLSAEVPDLESIGQYFEDMKNKLTQELTDNIRVQEMANQAQTFLEDKRTQLEPVATQFQDQMRTVAATVEEQFKPLAENMQAQVQPLVDDFQKQMQDILQKLMDRAKAIGN
ncbi:type-4 ice-structuring protein LS-12-like [Centroberyx affinis]|uniref:type-4 ice-structuring protein LS-12-like n=1 Tax=Centroberyx affinis TaxID=166261 RepID=UPI003A5BFF17